MVSRSSNRGLELGRSKLNFEPTWEDPLGWNWTEKLICFLIWSTKHWVTGILQLSYLLNKVLALFPTITTKNCSKYEPMIVFFVSQQEAHHSRGGNLPPALTLEALLHKPHGRHHEKGLSSPWNQNNLINAPICGTRGTDRGEAVMKGQDRGKWLAGPLQFISSEM